MRVYLSGAITGKPNYEKDFARAERAMTAIGNETINPCVLKPTLPNLSWEDYLKIDLALIDICDGLYMIQGWTKSKGARFELEYAKLHGKTVMYEGKRKPKKSRPLLEEWDKVLENANESRID